MINLADKCEGCRGPDRATDKAIALALLGPERFRDVEGPNYTASLDAAMSLKPDGWCIDAGTGGGAYALGPWARCYPDTQRGQLDGTGNRNAATVPLAICSAALRARAIADTDA
jgi:hypothetical protein